MKLNIKYKKTVKRIVSFTAAFAMMFTSMPMTEITEETNDLFSAIITAKADDALDALIAKYPGHDHSFTSGSIELVEYSQCFADTSFADDHKNDSITFNYTGSEFEYGSGYNPIGAENSPFCGTIYFNTSDTSFNISSGVPLFNYVSDTVKLYMLGTTTNMGLNFTRTADVPSGERSPLFANYVKGTLGNTTAAEWNITLTSGSSKSYSGVIGSLLNNARVDLTFTDNSNTISIHRNLADEIDDGSRIESKKASTNFGILCGDILGGSVLTASYSHSVDVYISGIESSYVGGLVGNISGSDSKFELTSSMLPKIIFDTTKNRAGIICGNSDDGTVILPTGLSINGTVKGAYASGVIGYCKDTDIQFGDSSGGSATLSNCTIEGSTAAGSIFGYYECNASANDSILNNSYTISGCEIKGGVAGGVTGEYKNNYETTTLDVSKFTFTSDSCISSGTVGGGVIGKYVASGDLTITSTANDNSFTPPTSSITFGGVIGEYSSLALINTLSITNIDINGLSCSATGGVGGVVRNITNSSYIAVADVSVTNANAENASYFGGIVSYLDNGNAGSFIDVTGDFTLSLASGKTYKGGAIAGSYKNGVIRLAGQTDISGAKAANGYAQLVYENDNTLIYAKGDGSTYTAAVIDSETGAVTTPASGWKFIRNAESTVSDLGQWGEIVRLIDGSDLEAANIVTLGTGDDLHKVTLAKTTTSATGTADFVKLALNMQLNDGSDHGALCFETGGISKATLMSSELTLSGTADLTGTGILGLMRDGGNGKYLDSSDNTFKGGVEFFTGTLTGSNNAEIIMAAGEAYGTYDGSSTGTGGRIYLSNNYGHDAQGLFAFAKGAKVNTLKVSGSIDVERNAGSIYLYSGALFGAMTNGAELTGVTVTTTINTKRANDARFYIGGIAGVFDGKETKDAGSYDFEIKSSSLIKPTIVLKGTIACESDYDKNNTYVGGVLGLLKGADATKYAVSIANSEVSPTINIDSAAANADLSYLGGMVGRVAKNSTNERSITLNTVTMTGASVDTKAKYAGGLLGAMWERTNLTVDGLTITGSTVNHKYSGTGSKQSGLAFMGTGKWDINSLTIQATSASTPVNTRFISTDIAPASFGLIVNEAYSGDDGLYITLLNSSYTLNGVTVPVSSTDENYYVDEIAADTSKGDIIAGGNGTGIININMNTAGGSKTKVSDTLSDQGTVTETGTGTYQNRLYAQLDTDDVQLIANQNSRYYYNLDVMSATGHTKTGGEKFLLWSVNQYAASNIKKYFSGDSTVSDIDLSGLSYYPINYASVSLADSSVVKLEYSGIDDKEDTTSPDGWDRDPVHAGTPQTDDARNQHYLMQTGLFHNVGSFSANSLTVKGDFGYVTNVAAGALINGQITGAFTIAGLALDGLAPSNANSALIVNYVNGEGTKTPSITLSTVSTTGYDSTNTSAVATSLFGSAKGQNLTMSFSGIKLDARNGQDITDLNWTNAAASAMNRAYGTTRSIFSNATLFNSLLSTATSDLVYNYTVEDDWGTSGATSLPRNVTYGKEVSDSKQYVGGEQHYYLAGEDTGNFTNPVSNNNASFDFKAGFLPYVANYEDKGQNSDYPITEIKVNYKVPGITAGCGTYNDPYVISTAAQLEQVAQIINGTSYPSTLKLPNITLTNTVSTSWHTADQGDGIYNLSGDNYTKATSNTNGVSGWDKTRVRYYFASAYYQINGNIDLTDAFEGIGVPNDSDNKFKGNTVFHGVIVGKGSTAPKITNPTNNPLIVVSNGSVVKNLQIENTANISRTQSETGNNALYGYNGSTTDAQYYGGVIGEIMGGDNIIDDVSVTYKGSTTLGGTYAHIIAEGGMVGCVVNGALIFRGSNSVTGRSSSGGGIYSNPIVGRVINGYAIYESISGRSGSAPANGSNYPIDTIVRNNTKLDVNYSAGTITVPNAQSLYILSLITQSIASTANTSGNEEYSSYSPSYGYNNYITGVARLGDYGEVGCGTTAAKPTDYSLYAYRDSVNNYCSSSEDLLKAPIPYIVYRYTTQYGADTITAKNYPARKMTSNNTKFWDITLEEDDSFASMDDFQAFRGIGSVGINAYATNNDASKTAFKVATFNGSGNILNLHISLPRYDRDQENYFHSQNKSLTQAYSGDNLGSPYGHDGDANLPKLMGLGLFDCVMVKKDSNHEYQFKNFTLQGIIEDIVYNTSGVEITGTTGKTQLFCIGGVYGKRIFRNASDVGFQAITFDGLTISCAYSCGGLVGIDAVKSVQTMKIDGCNSTENGISVTGGCYGENTDLRHGVGSFVGMTFWTRPYIDGDDSTTELVETANISVSNVTTFYDGDSYASVAGGLIGYTGSGAEIKNIKLSGLGSNPVIGSSKVLNAGGFIGFSQADNSNTQIGYIVFDNCTLNGISVQAKNSAAGFLARCGNTNDAYYPRAITISNCAVIGNSQNKPEIKAYGTGIDARFGAGGFIADFSMNKAASNGVIENSNVTGYKIEGNNTGGIIGAVNNKSAHLKNIYVKDCDIITYNANAGGLVGYSASNVLGYNLKIDSVSFSKRSGDDYTSSAGIIIGANSGNKSLTDKFIGIGAYNSTESKIPTKVVKSDNYKSDSFFVFADYLNASAPDITNNSSNKSTYNEANNVEQPKAPYLNVNPRMAMGIGEFITGDGAGAGVAGEIYSEAIKATANRSNRAYTTWISTKGYRSGNKTDQQILSNYINNDGSYKNGVFRISDFNTEFAGVEGIENVDNFAILVINNDTEKADDITPFIKSYIRLVTNTTSPTTGTAGEGAYSNSDNNDGKTYSVVIRPCSYSSGKFILGTAGDQGLQVHSGGSDNGKYEVSSDPDSKHENQFSLIDIQFKDPTDTTGTKIAYHLYVPVLTQKTMSVDYYSVSVTGTTYLPTNYTNKINSELAASRTETSLVESTGTWTTTLLRYEYPKNEVRSNYAWNHSKKLTLKIQNGFQDLPEGTKLILVDPNNNNDGAYTYTFDSAASGSFSLSLSDFVDESGTHHFKEQNLNTLLSSQSGKRGNDDVVYENYYISMYIPKNEGQTHLVRFESQTPLDVDVATGEEKPANSSKATVDQKLVSFVVLGDLYTHTINKLTVDSNQHKTEMTSGNDTLIIETEATITLNDISAGQYLVNTDILHSFYISLTSYEADGSISDYIKGIVRNDITSTGTAEYTDNNSAAQTVTISPTVGLGGNYVEIKTGDIKNMLLYGDHTVKISTETNMLFYDVTAFPYKTQEQIANNAYIGSVVGIKSNIAYNLIDLPYSPITAENASGVINPNSNYYYTTTQNFADLSFNAFPTDDTEDEIGYKTNNRSLLGVNGKYTSSPQLIAKSVYNASKIVDYEFASSIKYTVTLWKKQKGNDGITRYVQINNISDYLTNVELTDSEVSLTNISVDQKEYIYQGVINHNDPKDQDRKFEADFKCRVKTSDTSKREYANYKIELSAELINATNTKKMDYIVYTNALIDPEVIPES